MKKRRFFSKAISLVMAIIMTLAVIPVQAISFPQENEDISNEIVSTGNIETADQEVFIVEEDTSKRDQFEKHYLCSDGTYVSVTYPEAIHYLDDDNIWQDVDQSLTYNGASDVYSSDNADFNISFAAKGSSSNIVRIEKDGYALSWGIQATRKTPLIVYDSAIDKSAKAMSADETIISIPTSLSSAKLVSSSMPEFDKNADRLITNEDSFVLPNISSQISYTNVFGGDQNVTLAYTVYHNKIEEDIIISERGDIHSVSMNMDIGTLTPVVNSDGSVDLVDDDNNMQFHVGIPYMVDAAFSVCDDIQVTAKKDGNNCIITYTPNAEWFDSAERVFPVLLDPSITTNDYVVNMVDTYVEENSTVNHSSEQYLYINKNGSNRRKAIIRLKKLPQIDTSMPIVSASLRLTAQTAPTSSISLKAGYYDSALEMSEYTYNSISDSLFTYTTNSYLNSGSKTVTFDLSSHIYEMYSDLEFDIEEGYDYYGDFIISFSDNNNSTALAPFYSANYTTPDNRPVFTVKYGYTLPSDMMNGGVYSFQNVGSYSYMTVSGNPPADKSNVIQIQNDSGVATASQKFKLVYSSSTGGYKLYSENTSAGSDLVLAILRNSTDIKPNRNVHVTSPGDPISDEWLIVPIDYYVFRIVPRANMSLALTVYGDQDGTSNGKTPTSPGNVFVATLSENEDYQEWYIYDSNDDDVTAEDYPSTTETGDYYISNKYTGRYLHRTNNLGNCMSGTISSLGDETVNWKVVNLGDGYCTIQRSDIAGYFLAPTGTSNGSGVKVYQNTTGEIPDTYKWAITTASGGGCLIQNKASGYYLFAENQSANPSSVTVRSRYASGTDNYKRQVWRFAAEEDYLELGYNVSFNNIDMDIDETLGASVNSNAHWATYEDFNYTINSGSQYISYNGSTKKFTGITPGVATITATHMVTNISRTFEITVNCPTVVIPCTYAKTSSSPTIKSFAISITPYLEDYTSYLVGANWNQFDNGAVEFDLVNMTVKGLSEGLAWLEARKNGETILICYVYVENILKHYFTSIQEYLYRDGSWLGTFSCYKYEENPSVDPYILRTEWFLYAIHLCDQNKTKDEIKTELIRKFGLEIPDNYLFDTFISEVQLGARGGYGRDDIKLSFDGLRDLFNFFWFQYAAYRVATLDTVNVYTPATIQDVVEEQRVARKMCREARNVIQQAQQAQTTTGYNADNFQPTLLKKGTIICGLRDGQTAWYTTQECVTQSNYNVVTLYRKLQIQLNEQYGYRTKVGYYEVLEDIVVAHGIVANNPNCGEGGYLQYYIPNFDDILSLIREVSLSQ